jgi:hypothetical protein
MDAADASSSKGTIELWVDLALFFGGPLQEQTIKSLCFVERKKHKCAIYCKIRSTTIKEPIYARLQCKEESSKSDLVINGVMINNE